jgi:preprotein translocase subunit SecY
VSALGGGGGGPFGDKGLRMPLAETFRLAWADEELRPKILFVLFMFGVFVLGVNIQVPIPGVSVEKVHDLLKNNMMFQLLDTFGGGGLRRISILALGLNPYITSSIIMQILTTAFPAWKKELQEGGEYARRQQNRRDGAFFRSSVPRSLS